MISEDRPAPGSYGGAGPRLLSLFADLCPIVKGETYRIGSEVHIVLNRHEAEALHAELALLKERSE